MNAWKKIQLFPLNAFTCLFLPGSISSDSVCLARPACKLHLRRRPGSCESNDCLQRKKKKQLQVRIIFRCNLFSFLLFCATFSFPAKKTKKYIIHCCCHNFFVIVGLVCWEMDKIREEEDKSQGFPFCFVFLPQSSGHQKREKLRCGKDAMIFSFFSAVRSAINPKENSEKRRIF